uniref:Uncharacterized protein n=1 Tax=Panagrolaimus sp. PS1159 TaxID=55785 RepID=A0AC35GXJ7_9BILA
MPQQLAWIYILDICISAINLILILIVFGLLFKHWGTYHRNFWFILFQIHVAFFGIIAGNILAAFSMHSENERPLEKFFIPWKMGNFWSSFSGSFLEAGFYSLFLERSLATIKRSTYENITSFWFTAILSGLSLIYSLAISSMWHILPLFLVVIDISVSIPISFGLNLFCAMCVVLLSYYNRKLRKKELGTMCDLSQRYQIDENIKLLNQWLPVLFIGSITIISNGIFSICGYSFDIGINSYDNTMIYMMLIISTLMN